MIEFPPLAERHVGDSTPLTEGLATLMAEIDETPARSGYRKKRHLP